MTGHGSSTLRIPETCAEETTAAASSLRGKAAQLADLVQRFDTGAAPPPSADAPNPLDPAAMPGRQSGGPGAVLSIIRQLLAQKVLAK